MALCHAADDGVVSELGKQVTELPAGQHHVGIRKTIYEEGAHQRRGGSVWRRQSGLHRVGLGDRVTDHLRPAVQHLPGGVIAFVPRGEGGDVAAGVGRDHDRMCSRVSRTCSSVSAGSAASGTATRPGPCPSRRTGAGPGSISRRPSRARTSSSSPPARPSASRNAFGIACRPAASVVVRMPEKYYDDQAPRYSISASVPPQALDVEPAPCQCFLLERSLAAYGAPRVAAPTTDPLAAATAPGSPAIPTGALDGRMEQVSKAARPGGSLDSRVKW